MGKINPASAVLANIDTSCYPLNTDSASSESTSQLWHCPYHALGAQAGWEKAGWKKAGWKKHLPC